MPKDFPLRQRLLRIVPKRWRLKIASAIDWMDERTGRHLCWAALAVEVGQCDFPWGDDWPNLSAASCNTAEGGPCWCGKFSSTPLPQFEEV